jgi:hypothetical protein
VTDAVLLVALIAVLLLFVGWIVFPMLRTNAKGVSEPPIPGRTTTPAPPWHWSKAAWWGLVALGVVLVGDVALAVMSARFENLACGVNESTWVADLVFLLVPGLALLALVLVPVSIVGIWECASNHDFAYLLWIAVLIGSAIPLPLLIATNPFCPT